MVEQGSCQSCFQYNPADPGRDPLIPVFGGIVRCRFWFLLCFSSPRITCPSPSPRRHLVERAGLNLAAKDKLSMNAMVPLIAEVSAPAQHHVSIPATLLIPLLNAGHSIPIVSASISMHLHIAFRYCDSLIMRSAVVSSLINIYIHIDIRSLLLHHLPMLLSYSCCSACWYRSVSPRHPRKSAVSCSW
jgi:hypothetical protein